MYVARLFVTTVLLLYLDGLKPTYAHTPWSLDHWQQFVWPVNGHCLRKPPLVSRCYKGIPRSRNNKQTSQPSHLFAYIDNAARRINVWPGRMNNIQCDYIGAKAVITTRRPVLGYICWSECVCMCATPLWERISSGIKHYCNVLSDFWIFSAGDRLCLAVAQLWLDFKTARSYAVLSIADCPFGIGKYSNWNSMLRGTLYLSANYFL